MEKEIPFGLGMAKYQEEGRALGKPREVPFFKLNKKVDSQKSCGFQQIF